MLLLKIFLYFVLVGINVFFMLSKYQTWSVEIGLLSLVCLYLLVQI